MEKTKTCTKCGETWPATTEFFSKAKRGKYGLRAVCKMCRKEECKIYREANREKMAAYWKQYRLDHLEKYTLYGEQWRENNKDKIKDECRNWYIKNREHCLNAHREWKKNNQEKMKAQNKQYCAKNAEKIALTNKRWYQNNIDRVRLTSRARYERNKERYSETSRKWRKKNPEKCLEICKRRRTLKKGIPYRLSIQQWQEIKNKFNNKCAYCGKEKPLTQEHFIPVVKGGEYSINNILPVCKSCNCSKGKQDFFEWYPRYRYYSKKREKAILDHLGYKNGIQQLTLE